MASLQWSVYGLSNAAARLGKNTITAKTPGVVMKKIIGAAMGGMLVAVAGVSVAATLTSSKQADFFAPGKHQFYVWCAGGTDYTAVESGSSAEDAQMLLYNTAKAAGKAACWPVWQGRVAG